jgi:hypothetical protein
LTSNPQSLSRLPRISRLKSFFIRVHLCSSVVKNQKSFWPHFFDFKSRSLSRFQRGSRLK